VTCVTISRTVLGGSNIVCMPLSKYNREHIRMIDIPWPVLPGLWARSILALGLGHSYHWFRPFWIDLGSRRANLDLGFLFRIVMFDSLKKGVFRN